MLDCGAPPITPEFFNIGCVSAKCKFEQAQFAIALDLHYICSSARGGAKSCAAMYAG